MNQFAGARKNTTPSFRKTGLSSLALWQRVSFGQSPGGEASAETELRCVFC